MEDLISRQAAIDALKAHEDYKGYLHGDFEEILEALPSAQSEIIRCRDCMYWDKSWQTIEGCHYCGMIDKQTEGDFFCGDGEREEK